MVEMFICVFFLEIEKHMLRARENGGLKQHSLPDCLNDDDRLMFYSAEFL